MAFVLPFSPDGRAHRDEDPWPVKGSDRRLPRAATTVPHDGTSAPTGLPTPEAIGKTVLPTALPRRHLAFPDPVAFR